MTYDSRLLINILLISALVLTLITFILLIIVGIDPQLLKNQVLTRACTQEAKLCPDGSSVGRTGPKCEFAVCPTANKSGQVCIQVITPAKNSATGECREFPTPCDVPTGWQKVSSCPSSKIDTTNWRTYRNEEYGYEVKYPAEWHYSVSQIKIPANPEIVSFTQPDSKSYIEIRLTKNTIQTIKEELEIVWGPYIEVFRDYGFDDQYQIAGQRALRVSGELKDLPMESGNFGDVVIFKHQNPEMTCEIFLSAKGEGLKEIFENLINTFKFIPSTGSGQVEPVSYTACGCGCCGGVEPKTECLYHSKGGDIQKIIDADKSAAKSSDCKLMGCSKGIKYSYCD